MADNTYNIMVWSPTAGWSGNDFYQNISYTSNNSTMYHANDYSPTGVTWGHNIFDDAVSGNAAALSHTVASPLTKTTGWSTLTAGSVTASTFELSSAGAAAVAAWFGTTPVVSTPAISPDGGSFVTSQAVTLSTETTGTSIYYTTDGSTPTTGSTLYSAPFTLTANATVKVLATKSSYGNSNIASAVFTKTEASQAPYGGVAWAAPGTIYPWDYDTGGEDVAYHATSAGNAGGAYRSDDVDIWANGLPGAEAYAAIFATGEWLEFTLNVADTTNYDIAFNVGAPGAGRTFSMSIDGSSIASGVAVPNMGEELGYQYGQNVVTSNVAITAGTRVLRITGTAGFFNAYKIVITASGATVPVVPTGLTVVKDNTTTVAQGATACVKVAWNAAAGSDGYVVYQGVDTNHYILNTATTDTSQTICGIDPASPLFLSVRSFIGDIYSDFATGVECVMISQTIAGAGVTSFLGYQAVEKGSAHSITATPATNQRLTAYKIDDTWADWPSSNTISLGTVSADKTVQVVFQPIPTEKY
jgi:hypothetical protein